MDRMGIVGLRLKLARLFRLHRAWRCLFLSKGVYYSLHPRYGNCVSASVPLGMSLAAQEGRLNRGDKTLIVVGSAGVTVGLASFTF